ncbi:hypothetical protein L210DRAFT_3741401 [Boletus edulis BED1]|uniref:Uncharacterized protein n=1 Tax=Boletus edulis BED1 TaxID=1328754 RepID=A0AAD4G7G9_BOLED|nr:hypothetical protein L210DRAFT_3741401 [Boletus edulis BED1]
MRLQPLQGHHNKQHRARISDEDEDPVEQCVTRVEAMQLCKELEKAVLEYADGEDLGLLKQLCCCRAQLRKQQFASMRQVALHELGVPRPAGKKSGLAPTLVTLSNENFQIPDRRSLVNNALAVRPACHLTESDAKDVVDVLRLNYVYTAVVAHYRHNYELTEALRVQECPEGCGISLAKKWTDIFSVAHSSVCKRKVWIAARSIPDLSYPSLSNGSGSWSSNFSSSRWTVYVCWHALTASPLPLVFVGMGLSICYVFIANADARVPFGRSSGLVDLAKMLLHLSDPAPIQGYEYSTRDRRANACENSHSGHVQLRESQPVQFPELKSFEDKKHIIFEWQERMKASGFEERVCVVLSLYSCGVNGEVQVCPEGRGITLVRDSCMS